MSNLIPTANKGELKIGESQIAIYKPDNSVQLEVRMENETVWLTQTQIVDLFGSSKANISEHIKHIYKTQELEKVSTVRNFRTVRTEGKREVVRELDYYNLDMIIAIGYRVNTKKGTQFRIWANSVLKEYLMRGYAINNEILKEKNAKLISQLQTLSLLIINDIPLAKEVVKDIIKSQLRSE